MPHDMIYYSSVAASIKFSRGVLSCLKFLEAFPWSEEEEEKLRILFTKFKFDDATSTDIMTRLYGPESKNCSQTLVKQLLWPITTCVDPNAGNELKSLVRGLLSQSSVYEKDYDVNRGDVLAVFPIFSGLLA
ncbi:OLC1v1033917C1 [Oldenlandia corymbosa var. corymbosa]|uniref:OLC1v1033917C1 n=1 Tax=Oldenlandia corymbosa var. corymbosa TaxID=529605 RepID=A0AAV1CPC5_OLDCO|nr:OLC1v1033917C1 [Oldenlandia corymbosa var. corymbosa]